MISPLPARIDEVQQTSESSAEEPAYCMIIRDISDKRDASENLRKAVYCDHLTGLSNRRAFFEAADLELLRRKKYCDQYLLLCLMPITSRLLTTNTVTQLAMRFYVN